MNRRWDDLPWRISWRIRRSLLAVYGPPQLSAENDPVRRMEQERTAHVAARTARGR